MSAGLKNNLIPKLIKEAQSAKVHIGDETHWGNLAKGKNKRFWLWAVQSDRVVLFQIFETRSKIAAKTFLAGFTGTLLTDGYAAYASLRSSQLDLANDWSHVRRKFLTAEKTHPEESKFFVDQIRLLFKIEEKLQGCSLEEIAQIRAKTSAQIIDAIHTKCLEYSAVLPQSSLGRAIAYTIKLWNGLTVFLKNPNVPIHSNSIERIERSPVVGRKNHYGSKNIQTAEVAANWYSVIATCELEEIDPEKYITDTLKAILTGKPVLTPCEWKSHRSSLPDSS